MGRAINVVLKDDTARKNKSSASEEENLEAESSEESDSWEWIVLRAKERSLMSSSQGL